jgi:hypothetical protein
VIQEPLGDAPGDSTRKNDNGDYHDRRDNSIQVQSTMIHTMESELRERFSNANAYVVVVELNVLIASQGRIMKYEYLEKFLSIESEENTCLESHLATMHMIHGCLTDLAYWMTNGIAIDGVLCPLPPIYQDFFIGYVMQGESFSFHGFLTQLRIMKVEPLAGEVINDAGICDIQVINVSR